MFVPQLQIHIWKLSSLDNAIFKTIRLWWGHAGRAPMMVLMSLYEDEDTRTPSLLAMLGEPSAMQEESAYQASNLWLLYLGLSSLQNCKK